MLGKKIKFKLPKVPGKNFLKGKFITLEPTLRNLLYLQNISKILND